jgi:hypothetical protein
MRENLRLKESVQAVVNPPLAQAGVAQRKARDGTAVVEVLNVNHETLFLDVVPVSVAAPRLMSQSRWGFSGTHTVGPDYEQQEFVLPANAKLPWGEDPPQKPEAAYLKIWWSCNA